MSFVNPNVPRLYSAPFMHFLRLAEGSRRRGLGPQIEGYSYTQYIRNIAYKLTHITLQYCEKVLQLFEDY